MGMQMEQGVGDLQDDLEGSSHRQGVLQDELLERDAVDQLHGDVEPFFPFPLPVEFDDVGVACERDDAGFL